jgi:CRISPR-associated protein Cas1
VKTCLYVVDDDICLRLQGDAILVERAERKRSRTKEPTPGPPASSERVPLENTDSVVVSSRTMLTGPLMGRLREHGIAVSWVDDRGRLCARLEPHPSKNAVARRAQVTVALDPERSLEVARAMVRAKVRNQRVFLIRHARRGAAIPASVLVGLRDAELEAVRADGRERLMGHEGAAAKAYFEGLRVLVADSGMTFDGRSRQPPADSVNALLSYGYTLLAADCADAAAIAGLDPYIGFLHAERVGRAELALDLMEELRAPLVDSFVLAGIGRRMFTPEGFEQDGEGVRMTTETRRRFLEAWTEQKHREIVHPFLSTRHRLGQLPLLQARLLAKHCLELLPRYPPYVWR